MLSDSITADVCIVGAGITGLTAAYLLAKSGKSVVVVEKDKVGSGTTAYTTGFLCQIIDTDLSDAEKIWGIEKAGSILEGHKAAIDTIEKIVTEEKIECEFVRCPNYIFTTGDAGDLKKEYEAALRLGLEARFIDDPKLGFKATAAIEITGQAKFHPLKYLKGLAEEAGKAGVRIFEHTCASDIEAGHILYTDHGLIEADQFLFATYVPFQQPPGLFFKKGTYVTHIVELSLPQCRLPEGTYEDTENPYHYFRVDHDAHGARLLVGGEDHRREIPTTKKSEWALESLVKRLLVDTPYTIINRWSGPILEPSDGLPIIGPYEYDSTFYASGFSGNGLTYGTLAALMFIDHIEGRDNEWQETFNARRLPSLKGLAFKGRDYIGEFVGALKNIINREDRRRARRNSKPATLRVQQAQ